MEAFSPEQILSAFSPLLNEPYHRPVRWRSRKVRAGEVAVGEGLRLLGAPAGHEYEAVLQDFQCFLSCQSIPSTCGLPLSIGICQEEEDDHVVRVDLRSVTVRAGGARGLRSALTWMEDEMLARGGPFLPLGIRRRSAVVKTRLSRCFFGPIQRPPFHRNELADEIDYYPEPYLNRLAHEGVTGLWITMNLRESLPSVLFPSFGKGAAIHLAKLRRTVERCARYGIRVYVFCIEPAALSINSPILREHPELRGHVIDDQAAFCTSSEIGRAYLEEAGSTLLWEVPGLGGMIVIPVGERFTHCMSAPYGWGEGKRPPIDCPRCSSHGPYEVLSDTLAGLRRGMASVDPSAELIAWPYGQILSWGQKRTVEAAAHLPSDVILQHNFESGGVASQLGKARPLWDYWLSWVGPSEVYRDIARRVRQRKGRVFAKLQVGHSHEIATVPFIPVPGLLYRKYQAMHELGVSGAMQSWYFGNYPSLMTRAAGLLSFAPLPKDEVAFLRELARREWGSLHQKVARAWAIFGRAYENYPASHFFGYYGPVQDGVTWPLYLEPRNFPLAPTWKLGFPPSGDYIADCLSSQFSLREVELLCGRMAKGWDRGLRVLRGAFEASEQSPTQCHEWRVAEAISLHFNNAWAVLRFYLLRERLVQARSPRARLKVLDELEAIVRGEIELRQRFLHLMKNEPSLGYHSEAEGFKVTRQRVRDGISQLRKLLRTEFRKVRKGAVGDDAWFDDYTGAWPRGQMLRVGGGEPSASVMALSHWMKLGSDSANGAGWEPVERGLRGVKGELRIAVRDRVLSIQVRMADVEGVLFAEESPWRTTIVAEIVSARTRPRVKFTLQSSGEKQGIADDGYVAPSPTFEARWRKSERGGDAELEIPFHSLEWKGNFRRFRLCVRVQFFHQQTGDRYELSWQKREPLPSRLAWEDVNPATDYGWVLVA